MELLHGQELTPVQIEEYLSRQGYWHWGEQLALYGDADGAVFYDAVFGPVLEWRDRAGRWRYVAVSPEWALQSDKPEFNAPWFPEGIGSEIEDSIDEIKQGAKQGAEAGINAARSLFPSLPDPLAPVNRALDLAVPALVVAGIIGAVILSREIRQLSHNA